MPDIFVDTDQNQPQPPQPQKKTQETAELPLNGSLPPKPRHRHEIGTLEAFCEYPKGVTFQHQENDEEIILFLRQHFITNVPWIIITILLAITPFILIPFLRFSSLFPFTIPDKFLFVSLLFYYLIIIGYAFVNFLHWFYNIGIVTNKRVVDLDYTAIVHVHVAATKVLQIQDVNYVQTGFLRTLFNFGDVFIQTAGQNLNFEFLRVPRPSKATFIIQKLIGIA